MTAFVEQDKQGTHSVGVFGSLALEAEPINLRILYVSDVRAVRPEQLEGQNRRLFSELSQPGTS
jgi:hypothetical protein